MSGVNQNGVFYAGDNYQWCQYSFAQEYFFFIQRYHPMPGNLTVQMNGAHGSINQAAVHGLVFLYSLGKADNEALLLEEGCRLMVIWRGFEKNIQVFILPSKNMLALEEDIREVALSKEI